MIIYRSAKVIEELFLSAIQKITAPKSVKDTIYGTFLALAALFCLLFAFEQLIGR
ncbi:hypothetical protein AB8878_11670 [Alphaproteobacteria bacterium LSUCC0226]|jgi:hypothetical protein|nr:hypothetical protein [Candidatus Puniceispirillum sp.]MBL6774462.1 hypothetical protein [Candidatus Puniceispirillum sp.]